MQKKHEVEKKQVSKLTPDFEPQADNLQTKINSTLLIKLESLVAVTNDKELQNEEGGTYIEPDLDLGPLSVSGSF
ncbi:hypothetical protein Ciccas_013936 [Cichlidogyrus casuarinus]|uniref:Uncharacterized protein n=1 Tax=Cichlidogyrus casuarinus TaxID=1844966 RepID=A0ABD2PJA8_9PLAT